MPVTDCQSQARARTDLARRSLSHYGYVSTVSCHGTVTVTQASTGDSDLAVLGQPGSPVWPGPAAPCRNHDPIEPRVPVTHWQACD